MKTIQSTTVSLRTNPKARKAGKARKTGLRPSILATSIATLLALGATAQAQLLINPTYDATINARPDALQIKAGIQTAINQIQSLVTTFNPSTVSILFSADTSGLASSLTAKDTTLTIAQYQAALAANPTQSALQTAAIATMPSGPIAALNNNTNMKLASAQLRALGFTALADAAKAANGGYDSQIGFYFPIINTDRLAPTVGNYDLIAATMHELDEAVNGGRKVRRVPVEK